MKLFYKKKQQLINKASCAKRDVSLLPSLLLLLPSFRDRRASLSLIHFFIFIYLTVIYIKKKHPALVHVENPLQILNFVGRFPSLPDTWPTRRLTHTRQKNEARPRPSSTHRHRPRRLPEAASTQPPDAASTPPRLPPRPSRPPTHATRRRLDATGRAAASTTCPADAAGLAAAGRATTSTPPETPLPPRPSLLTPPDRLFHVNLGDQVSVVPAFLCALICFAGYFYSDLIQLQLYKCIHVCLLTLIPSKYHYQYYRCTTNALHCLRFCVLWFALLWNL